MQAIADLLGHSSMDITAIYARVVDHRKYTPGEPLYLNCGAYIEVPRTPLPRVR